MKLASQSNTMADRRRTSRRTTIEGVAGRQDVRALASGRPGLAKPDSTTEMAQATLR